MTRPSANTVDLFHEEKGTGDPLVLIHGLGSASYDWRAQIEELADAYRVIALDLRGHGRSEKPRGPYSIPQFAADVSAVLTRLDVRPAHLVGLSLGGMVAFQLAVDTPELVRSLVIINSAPAVLMDSFKMRAVLALRLFILKVFGLRVLGRIIARGLLPRREQQPLRREFVARFARNDPHAYEASMRAIVNWSVADRLGEIRCPVLVLSGDRDYTPVEAKERYVRLIPKARLEVIPDAGHAWTLERAELVNDALRRFLAHV